ncbi:MAG: cupredoxin domain-containing protein [Actinomycetota bacterium]
MAERVIGVACTLVGAALIALAACSQGPGDGSRGTGERADRAADAGDAGSAEDSGGTTRPARVDPRRGGLEVSLGEGAVTPEAVTIRPGRITLVITNRGTIDHGFEIEADEDHSGHGGGDGFKLETELLAPGESTRVRVDLAPGTYKIECLVEGHDDMGMEDILHVRAGAPLVRQASVASRGTKVSIENFAFAPRTIEVKAGTQITWTNDDPTEHTVTGDGSALSSDVLGSGDKFSARIDEPGTYDYRCSIHPEMTARIQVSE